MEDKMNKYKLIGCGIVLIPVFFALITGNSLNPEPDTFLYGFLMAISFLIMGSGMTIYILNNKLMMADKKKAKARILCNWDFISIIR